MDFTVTQEQQDICASIQELCKKNLNENVFDDDETSSFPMAKWKACGAFGLPGLPIPETYGGLGQTMLTTALAVQSLGYGCRDEGLVFALCAHMLTCAVPLWHFGTEEQKKNLLPKVCSGESIGGNGITEANAGSDSASIATRVMKENDGYRINGSKIFVTNAPVADLFIIYAKHPQGMRLLDISAFILETGTPGMKIGQVFKKMGLRTCTLGEVLFDDCRVPAHHLLGRERRGMEVFNHSILWERIIMGAYHVGAMEQQYALTAEYAAMRKQFGTTIIKLSAVADKLVDMKLRIETAKLMLYKVCWSYDHTAVDLADAAMVKVLTSESKVQNSLDAVQIFGAYGYIKECQIEKQLRDSIAATIYSGTNEIQRKIIAEKIGGAQ